MKRHLAAVLALAVLAMMFLPAGQALAGEGLLKGKKIVLVIAFTDFRDEEFLVPQKAFEDAGALVTVASTKLGDATGMLGARVRANALVKDLDASQFDAVVFVGGVGARTYFADPAALSLARQAVSRAKVVGAICLAPVILAKAGVLSGRHCTVYEGAAQDVKDNGCVYAAQDVVVDKSVITASGPQAAQAFASAVISALGKKKK